MSGYKTRFLLIIKKKPLKTTMSFSSFFVDDILNYARLTKALVLSP